MKPILEESRQLSGLMKAGLSFKNFGPQASAQQNSVQSLISSHNDISNVLPLRRYRSEWSRPPDIPRQNLQDIADFIFFPVINEGCRVVEERIVEKPSDLDVASVLGMGFPPYRGGIIKYADLVGAKHIVARLKVSLDIRQFLPTAITKQ